VYLRIQYQRIFAPIGADGHSHNYGFVAGYNSMRCTDNAVDHTVAGRVDAALAF